ncbi:hypothetical protein JCM14076_21210 [Methylosoma difficile]
MLKRLYIHNYKCLVNFEINFEKDISLFLGANGSGKSTVFEVLAKLKRVIVEEEKIANIFDKNDKPRWLKSNSPGLDLIRFELDIELKNALFRYILIISFDDWDDEASIKEESLALNDMMFLQSKDEITSFLIKKQEFSFDNARSSINRYLSSVGFVQYLSSLFIVRINPYAMSSIINKATTEVKTDFSNYAEWFAHLNEKSRREVSTFESMARDILYGFDYFRIEQAGQAKVLQVEFKDQSNKKDIITYYFNELSEGQKVLIALYALAYCAPENSLICIDEPENFLALPEIQPWFDTLYDQCAERGLQALLISHHPRIINYLAGDSGYWFYRESNLTRIKQITAENEDGLSIAELVERGWIDDL